MPTNGGRQQLEMWLQEYRALPAEKKKSFVSAVSLLKSRPRGLPSIVCCNALLGEGVRDNNLLLLEHVRASMLHRGIHPNLITYNTLIKGYLESAGDDSAPADTHQAKARSLMEEMRGKGLHPNSRTYTPLLSFLADRGLADEIEAVLADMARDNVERDVITYNTVLKGYGKAGQLEKMERLFHEWRSTNVMKPSGVTYHTLMNCFGSNGQAAKMIEYWNLMRQDNRKRSHEVEINERTYTILIAGFGDCRDKEAMLRTWEEFKQHGRVRPNHHSYGCLIDKLGSLGDIERMLDIYREVRQTIGATEVIYNHVLSHLGKTGRVEQAEELFADMSQDGGVKPNIMLYNVMLDIYAKATLNEKAEALYRELLDRKLVPTRVTFATLLEAETRARRWNRVEGIIHQMETQGVRPDAVVLNNLIDAYGFMNQPDLAEEVVEELIPKHGLVPDPNHLTSLIEAWARNGRLDKAEAWLGRVAEQTAQGTKADEEARAKALLTFVSFCQSANDETRINRARRLLGQHLPE